MCSKIIKECRIDNVYYFVDSNDNNSYLTNVIKVENYSEYSDLFTSILKDYFKNNRVCGKFPFSVCCLRKYPVRLSPICRSFSVAFTYFHKNWGRGNNCLW